MGQVQPAGQFPSSDIELQKTAMQHWDVLAPLISFLIFREHEQNYSYRSQWSIQETS